MENEFVSYTQALALKELGFDEPCLAYYNTEKLFKFPGTTMSNRNFLDLLTVTAPLYQQAFKFFREKHNMRVWVEWGSEYLCCAMIQHSSGMKECIDCCSNNEEAEQTCLDKLIEICRLSK